MTEFESCFGNIPFVPVDGRWKRTCRIYLDRSDAIKYFDPESFNIFSVFGFVEIAQGFIPSIGKTPIVIEDISQAMVLP